MITTDYLQALVTAAGALMGVWGFIKVVKEMKKDNDAEHERRMGWDHAAKVIKEKEQKWDEGLDDVYEDRKQIVKRYDGRLDEQDAKIQQLYAMFVMMLKSQNAILEALIEQGIGNGEIKDMHRELNDFITDQVGK